jgi:hypothetical protein
MKSKYVGDSINLIYATNIYENSRNQDLVDYRSLCCYILHKDLKMTLYAVRDHFNRNGKAMNHCSVLHNVKLYNEVRSRKPHLDSARDMILGKLDPKYSLLKRIENIDDEIKIEQITNCVNHYE